MFKETQKRIKKQEKMEELVTSVLDDVFLQIQEEECLDFYLSYKKDKFGIFTKNVLETVKTTLEELDWFCNILDIEEQDDYGLQILWEST